jgi:copper(I)-binding protein
MKKIMTWLLISLLHISLFPQQSRSSQQIIIDKIWSRPVHAAVDNQGKYLSNGVVYLTISNTGPADTLVSVETDVCRKVELHQSKMVDGIMTMNMLKKGLDAPAHGMVEMKPGSYHIMLIGMRHNLDPGDTFALTLYFEKNDPVTILSYVKSP